LSPNTEKPKNPMGKKLVVIGGTAAGLSAASKAKRSLPGLSVAVFEKTGYVSYGSCGLPYFIGGLIREPGDLVSLTASELQEKRGISVFIRHEVTRINRERKELQVRALGTGKTFTESYDYLVIATGARALVLDIPGADAQGVYTLRSVEDGVRIREAVEKGARRVLIVGAGPIGLELAEQLTERGCKTELVEFLPRLLPVFPENYAHEAARTLAARGVGLRLGVTAKEVLVRDGKASGIRLANGEEIPVDIVLFAAGVAPNSELAKDCGLKLGVKESIVTSPDMRTTDPCIWACGDCAQTFNRITGKPVYMPLGTSANKQGRVAGASIAGEAAAFPGVVLSMACKIFDLYAAATGLNLDAAREAGFNAAQSAVTKGDRASYYPGSIDNKINLVFEKSGGRILGAQGIGGVSVAGRMNLLAAAVTMGMTAAQLGELDLVYTPSVAPVYDPLLIAASAALKFVD
jgi:NADPH-dependent 2,4-dienoyl-CoA reductase/sulfur reductase-like enzyme